MKNKIYPFLLGLSCIVIVALVSFKNSEKVVEKEQMIILLKGGTSVKNYELFISTVDKYEKSEVNEKESFKYTVLLSKIQEYQKEGWVVTNSYASTGPGFNLHYTLEREKK